MEDIVLLAGDFCWAMTLDDALSDLKLKASGEKGVVRGNHDFGGRGSQRCAPRARFFLLFSAKRLHSV